MPIDDALAQLSPGIKYEQNLSIMDAPSDEFFYKFPIYYVNQNLSLDYINLLKNSGYAPEIDKASGLMISKKMLSVNADVRLSALYNSFDFKVSNKDYLVKINQTDGRKLVESLGYKLPTAAIMYKLFIPYLKNMVELSKEAKATLEEMSTKIEWLDDEIIDQEIIKIGDIETKLNILKQVGSFNKADLNDFGYPNVVKEDLDQGEYNYWPPKGNKNAVIRNQSSSFSLDCNWKAHDSDSVLGVRLVKFYSRMKKS